MTVSTVAQKMMALVAAFALLLSAFPTPVVEARSAVVPVGVITNKNTQVDLCHKNQGASEYSLVQSKAQEIVEESNQGHPPSDNQHAQDIIPPFQYDFGTASGTFPGRNWGGTPSGESIFNADCTLPPTDATLTITKSVVGTSTPTSAFSYELDGGAGVAFDTASKQETINVGDAYAVEETGESAGKVTVAGATYDVTYSAGCSGTMSTDTTCTITNTYVPVPPPTVERASLTIEKEIVSTVGLTGWSFDFSGDAGAFTLTNSTTSQTFTDISVGSYTVTEAAVANWALTNVTCDATFATTTNGLSLTLADGDDVTCTFTNTYTEPTTKPIPGCTDATASNYNPAATVDDGSCTYTAPQCIAANLLTNPSFEEPVITGSYEQLSSIPGWTATNDVEIWRNLQGGASDGAQNVELDVVTGTTMSQMVTTTPGATYLVSYDFSARNGRPLADNEMDVLVDTAVEQSVALDGTGQVTNTWKPYWFTFDATGTSTDVAFAYSGTENGYGSLLDNAVVCLVEEAPVLGCTDPLATNYDAAATQDDGSCVLPPPAPNACTVTIMSDETNTVTEKSGAFAQALSFVHPAWTAVITGAAWIWGDDPVADSAVEETQTFVKEFFWNGTSTSAVLDIASDNGYTVTLNGTLFGGDAAENNFALATQDTHDLNALMQQGTNTLMIAVTNLAGSANPASNPAGLLYSMTVTGTTEIDCTAEPVMEPTPTRRSGGGGVLTSRPRTPDLPEPTPEVAGEAVSNIPEPQVLGEQVSIVPVGAPATGKGGATAVTFAVGQLLAVPRRFNRN